jgi:hypothetical protein
MIPSILTVSIFVCLDNFAPTSVLFKLYTEYCRLFPSLAIKNTIVDIKIGLHKFPLNPGVRIKEYLG